MTEQIESSDESILNPIQDSLKQQLETTVGLVLENSSGEAINSQLIGRAEQVSKDSAYFFDQNLADAESQALTTAGIGYLDGSIGRDEYFTQRQAALPVVWLRNGIGTGNGLRQFDTSEQADAFPALREVAQAFGQYEQVSSAMLPPTLPSGRTITSPIDGNAAKLRGFRTFEDLTEASRRLNTFRTISGMDVDGWLDIEDNAHGHVYYPGEVDPAAQEDFTDDHQFKIHLMPTPNKVVEMTKTLATFANENPDFKRSIHSFKSRLSSEVADTLPMPEIVIYPIGTEENVTNVLQQVLKLCEGQPGIGLVPRFNIPVGSSDIVFLAQGEGLAKQQSYEHEQGSDQYLGEPGEEQYIDHFSADHNYALNSGDLEVAQRILSNAINQ